MIRQEVVVCQKCGALKEMSKPCDCSEEEKKEDEWRGSNLTFASQCHSVSVSPRHPILLRGAVNSLHLEPLFHRPLVPRRRDSFRRPCLPAGRGASAVNAINFMLPLINP